VNGQLDDLAFEHTAHHDPLDHKPIFFGHYWRTIPARFDANNAFCLDYSAGKGGHLTAYRFDPGHTAFDPNRIVHVSVGPENASSKLI